VRRAPLHALICCWVDVSRRTFPALSGSKPVRRYDRGGLVEQVRCVGGVLYHPPTLYEHVLPPKLGRSPLKKTFQRIKFAGGALGFPLPAAMGVRKRPVHVSGLPVGTELH